ncbi:MAG: PilZ domain-containing protein [Candidatus Thiodiazotropha sp. 6PLUC2]
MDARKTPRTKTSFKVTLIYMSNGVEQIRVITDISKSGIFVNALSGSKHNERYKVDFRKPGQPESLLLAARVTRINPKGSALSFEQLHPQESQFLTELIHPSWDGKDLLEGVIMHGILENTTDFASCMRLTSLLSSDYRYTSRANQ